MRLFTVLCFSFVFVSLAYGMLPEVMQWGSQYPSTSARALGMGNSDFLDPSPAGTLINPALLGLSDNGLCFSLSGGVYRMTERRSVKVYDSFGSAMGESETAFNDLIDMFCSSAAVSVKGVEWLPASLAISAGFRRPNTFDYDYHRINRNDYYVKTGEESLEISGGINELGTSLAFSPTETFTFGLGFSYSFGSRNQRWEETFSDPVIPDVLEEINTDISSASIRGGLLVDVFDRVSILAGVEKPMFYEISGDEETDVSFPIKLTIGGIYVPGNQLRTRFSGGAYWSSDNTAELDGVSLELKNSWGVSAGVEHFFPGGPAGRFGFRYDRSPQSQSLDAISFTAGIGTAVAENYLLDFGFSFSPRKWRTTSISNLPSFDACDTLTVEETSTFFLISLSRTFGI